MVIKIEEMVHAEMEVKKTMYQQVSEGSVLMAEHVASYPPGQIVLKFADYILWIVETSVKWFVEQKTPSSENISQMDLIRPLPWILFLPFLLSLRLTKICLEAIAYLRNKEPLHPKEVVQYIQVRRRRLRAIKFAGIKNYIKRKEEYERNIEINGQCVFVRIFLYLFSQMGLRKICLTVEDGYKVSALEDELSSDDNENLQEKIDRLCHESENGEDPDYEPCEDSTDVSILTDEEENITILNKSALNDSSANDESHDKNEDSDDSSSTLSLETAEASSATSQTYYSPLGSSGTTPEPVFHSPHPIQSDEVKQPPLLITSVESEQSSVIVSADLQSSSKTSNFQKESNVNSSSTQPDTSVNSFGSTNTVEAKNNLIQEELIYIATSDKSKGDSFNKLKLEYSKSDSSKITNEKHSKMLDEEKTESSINVKFINMDNSKLKSDISIQKLQENEVPLSKTSGCNVTETITSKNNENLSESHTSSRNINFPESKKILKIENSFPAKNKFSNLFQRKK